MVARWLQLSYMIYPYAYAEQFQCAKCHGINHLDADTEVPSCFEAWEAFRRGGAQRPLDSRQLTVDCRSLVWMDRPTISFDNDGRIRVLDAEKYKVAEELEKESRSFLSRM